jgi:tetratricopeptide (TPR) repeat protein
MASPEGSALALIKAVLDLVADRRTGVLDVLSEGVRTQIYFDDGKPVFADDEALGESFGRLLMRQGVITNDQFVRVIDDMTRAAMGNSQLRFGEVAVNLGVLTPEKVERGLADQVCGIIARSLQRALSEWTFRPAPAAKPPRSFSLEINPAVLAALGQPADRATVADVVAARPEEFVVVAGPRPAADVPEEARATAPDMHAARMTAEQAFQKGLALLREGKAASAAIELRRASELQPESLEYELYAIWARSRSYREIPSEPDQHALLDIAQKAKRRDPMFAFASYVLGQLAMWAGNDAEAKKWFYEALRLDPASEAGKQVRILARRSGGAGLSYVGPLPAPPPLPVEALTSEPAPGPAPVPAREPPRQPARSALPAAAQSSSWGKRLVAGGAVLAALALAIFAVARNQAPGTGPAPATSPQPEPPVNPTPTPPAEPENRAAPAPPGVPAAGPTATGPEPEKKEVKASGDKEGEGADTGTVVWPARAADHRIFVDGRRAKTDGVAPLHIRCGAHTIQIGSSGTAESIDVPCGGEVQLQ